MSLLGKKSPKPVRGETVLIRSSLPVSVLLLVNRLQAVLEAQEPPKLAFNPKASTESYLVICLDIDAPFQSLPVLSPLLHWIQPGLKPERTVDGNAKLTASDTPFVANYFGPSPPPGSGAHRYVFLLYEQPAGFDGKKYAPAGGAKMGPWPRMRYDLGAFESGAKLGPVIAANYFSSN